MYALNNDIKLRRARYGDVKPVRDLMNRTFDKYITRMGRKPTPMTDNYESILCHDVVWIIEGPNGLIATMILRMQDSSLCVETLAVDPSYQGKGIGSMMLKLAEHEAAKHFHDRVTLCTHETMVENAALYTRRGYVETHRKPKLGSEVIWFAKELARPMVA